MVAILISTADEFLAALREHPEWRDAVRREILGAEFYDLPATLDRLAATVAAFAADTARRFEELEQRLAEMKQDTDSRFDRVDERFEQVDRRFDGLDQRLDRMDQRFEGVQEHLEQHDRQLAYLVGRVGDMDGRWYKQRYQAVARLNRVLRRATRVDLGTWDAFQDAIENDLISSEEFTQVALADGVYRGRREGHEAYAVIEISITIDGRDVARAADRAAILRKAGFDVLACAGGQAITPDAASAAEHLNVNVFVDKETA
ncbi:MAG: hypothetical protein ACKVVT_19600 [Dehalococcoidia bacterium]